MRGEIGSNVERALDRSTALHGDLGRSRRVVQQFTDSHCELCAIVRRHEPAGDVAADDLAKSDVVGGHDRRARCESLQQHHAE